MAVLLSTKATTMEDWRDALLEVARTLETSTLTSRVSEGEIVSLTGTIPATCARCG